MAKKNHKHRKFGLPKTVGGWVNLTFKVLGGVVIASPAIGVIVQDMQGNAPMNIPSDVLFAYTGVKAGEAFNWSQLGIGVGTIAGGVGLIYLGKFLGKVIR